MHTIYDSLQKVGLTDKEARIYTALLGLGSASAGLVSEESGIKRPTTYLVLEGLRQKGMVLKTPYAKGARYQAKQPDDLHEQIVRNVQAFERILPDLKKVAPPTPAIGTFYFEGISGMKDALYYKISDLSGTALFGFWAKTDKIRPKMLGVLKKWSVELEKNKITAQGATVDHSSIQKLKKQHPKYYRSISLISKDLYISDVSIDVTKKFIRLLDPVQLKAVIIENQNMADAILQILKLAEAKSTH